MVNSSPRPLVILGAGYTGRFLYQLATAQGWYTLATSRAPGTHLRHIPLHHRLEFDLHRPETWLNIPDGAHIIWCFPAIPQDAASQFMRQWLSQGSRIIVLGSAAAYRADPDNLVDEGSPLNLTLPRVQSEEYLRTTYGAIILRLAGLYGVGRNVLDWMRAGKVKNTNRLVNLVHVEDVAAVCLISLEKAKEGELYIVSDGSPRRWSEIFATAAERWGLTQPLLSHPLNLGKRLSVEKLRAQLNYQFQYPDLYKALEDIEARRRG